jgi:hypothetical protein
MFNMSTKDKLKNETPTFGNTVLPAVYFAVYVDGDYKQVVTVKADSEEQAERRLIYAGWNAPVRFEQMIFDLDNVCVIFNGR